MKMKSLVAVVCGLLMMNGVFATGNLLTSHDKGNVTFIKNTKRLPDAGWQAELRHRPAWQNFLQTHGTWYVQFNEDSHLPHRAFGKPIPTVGVDPESRALFFANNFLSEFDLPVNELHLQTINSNSKHINVIFHQEHQGIDLLWSRFYVKMLHNGDVIMFGTEMHRDIDLNLIPTFGETVAVNAASQDLPAPVVSATIMNDLHILPIPGNKEYKYHLVYEVEVNTMGEDKIPGKYRTFVDAHSGEVLYRQNQVMHFCEHDHGHGDEECDAPTAYHVPANDMLPPPIAMTLEGTIISNPVMPTTATAAMANAQVEVNGTTYHTDANGMLTLPDNNPVTATLTLTGLFCDVLLGANGNTQSSYTTTLNPGTVTESWDGNALDTEISAYVGVNNIHQHMKLFVDPGFTTLDNPMTTRVDRTDGDCNAFYNGVSINFYAAGNGCPATAYFDDVVYHEYGHGINNDYYQYFGGFFGNGALNEGYADIWAMSYTLNPVLGEGFQGDPNSFVRRYDIDPKVYPQDLVGEVHADGEIICGAWWDLGLDIGVNSMMDIFINTYPAVLSEPNGNEGVLYTDVLLEALAYDDNDGDITNGTPNGVAIVEHFDAHGITLLSNAEVTHADLQNEPPNQDITIEADLTLTFPWTTYLSNLSCFYRINDGTTWTTAPMSNGGSGSTYTVDLPAQPFGTIIAYYIGAEDLFGNTSGVQPFAADEDDAPNMPYFIMVGFAKQLEEDLDFNSQFGNWEVGLPSDNATTGEWEINIPLGSFGDVNDPSTMVAPDHQHTPNGELCFLTGKANTVNDAIGANDVDGGTTTLVSPTIDLTGYNTPAFSFWRWYINNPPSGANPNADWWQVYVSDDDGASWVPVEDTRRSDASWRRYAFRVEDYVTPNDQFKMKFHVSDSLRPGQNLDGGSLIEAALDDIILWQEADPNSIDEHAALSSYALYPNPAADYALVAFELPQQEAVTLTVVNAIGEVIEVQQLGNLQGRQQVQLDTRTLAEGVYLVTLEVGGERIVRRLTVVH